MLLKLSWTDQYHPTQFSLLDRRPIARHPAFGFSSPGTPGSTARGSVGALGFRLPFLPAPHHQSTTSSSTITRTTCRFVVHKTAPCPECTYSGRFCCPRADAKPIIGRHIIEVVQMSGHVDLIFGHVQPTTAALSEFDPRVLARKTNQRLAASLPAPALSWMTVDGLMRCPEAQFHQNSVRTA